MTIFPPVSPPKEIRAIEISTNPRIDGRLDETDWQVARPGSGFFQAQPEQGKPLTFDTQVRVLFNRKFLYVGAFEGAHYYHCDAFRPEFSCMMRNYAGFCAVCRRHIRSVITAASGPITTGVTLDTTSIDFNDIPAGTTTVRAAVFTVNLCAPTTFTIISGPSIANVVVVLWCVCFRSQKHTHQ